MIEHPHPMEPCIMGTPRLSPSYEPFLPQEPAQPSKHLTTVDMINTREFKCASTWTTTKTIPSHKQPHDEAQNKHSTPSGVLVTYHDEYWNILISSDWTLNEQGKPL